MQFTIEQKTLSAVSKFAATTDIRYYLVGVKIEYSPHFTRAVATNGHILGIRQEDRKSENIGSGELIIPLAAIDLLNKTRPQKGQSDDVTVSSDDGKLWRARLASTEIAFTAIDATYPEYRRVIPDELSDVPATYDPKYLLAAQKSGETIQKKATMRLRQNGQKAGLIRIADLVIIIMPVYRPKEDLADVPNWARIDVDSLIPLPDASSQLAAA